MSDSDFMTTLEVGTIGGLPEQLVGQPVFIRTVTMYYVGTVASCEHGFVRLDNASWVADTGRFSVALATGKLNEVEKYPAEVYINTGSIVDITPWAHELPTATR